jgi:uncharacterized protein (DUF1330 family)
MSYYFVAQIRINNAEEYEKYLEKADDIFSQNKGQYLAVDESPAILEGKWDYTKSVIIKFDSTEDFYKWYHSADYQEILKYRLASSDCDTILVKGFDLES